MSICRLIIPPFLFRLVKKMSHCTFRVDDLFHSTHYIPLPFVSGIRFLLTLFRLATVPTGFLCLNYSNAIR